MKQFSILLALLFFLSIPSIAVSQETDQMIDYQPKLLEVVNDRRKESGLKPFIIDEDLCMLAEELAVESELMYPDGIQGSLYSNPKYKKYLENYPNFESSRFTINDILVNVNRKAGIETTYTYDDLARVLADDKMFNLILEPDLTHGCPGASSGKQGYKPFVYFIAGVRKEPDSQIVVFIKSFLSRFGIEFK